MFTAEEQPLLTGSDNDIDEFVDCDTSQQPVGSARSGRITTLLPDTTPSLLGHPLRTSSAGFLAPRKPGTAKSLPEDRHNRRHDHRLRPRTAMRPHPHRRNAVHTAPDAFHHILPAFRIQIKVQINENFVLSKRRRKKQIRLLMPLALISKRPRHKSQLIPSDHRPDISRKSVPNERSSSARIR